jgi:formylglycine-generating enzyme
MSQRSSMGARCVRGCAGGTLAAVALSLACAQIVGITDTEVTRPESALGSNLAQGGSAGATSGEQPERADGSPAPGAAGAGGTLSVGPGAGSGGMPMPAEAAGTPMLVGAGGMPVMAACVEQAARCSGTPALAGGREVCTGGLWQASPCPPETPTCEGEGQCVVRGPALISVGGAFFVDATEVTVGQYRQFVAAKNGDMSGQPAVCSWNQLYYEEIAYEPDDEPIRMVDWCDAYAFCAWSGKRLCGGVGGGPVASAELDDQTRNQWYLACGGPAGNYRSSDNPVCNLSRGFESVAPVASFPGCEGSYPGLFDMLGNVWEWIDSCDSETGPDDLCNQMGGSTINGDSYCYFVRDNSGVSEAPWLRSTKTQYSGFRCCT